MTKKNYIRELGAIAESMFMCNPGYSWRGSMACRDFSKNRKENRQEKTAVRCAAVFFTAFGCGNAIDSRPGHLTKTRETFTIILLHAGLVHR